jgi:hypothetical protein
LLRRSSPAISSRLERIFNWTVTTEDSVGDTANVSQDAIPGHSIPASAPGRTRKWGCSWYVFDFLVRSVISVSSTCQQVTQTTATSRALQARISSNISLNAHLPTQSEVPIVESHVFSPTLHYNSRNLSSLVNSIPHSRLSLPMQHSQQVPKLEIV